MLPERTQTVVGDLTDPGALWKAAADVTGIVFIHGSRGDARTAERVGYGAVRNVVSALETPARIAWMTGDRGHRKQLRA